MKAAIALLIMLMAAGCRSTSDLEVVSGFDLDRYLGVWYEAARYPHGFEEGLVSVTATYTRNENGTIRVENRGYDPVKAEWKKAEGVAKMKGDPEKGWLKVSFFGPFYASYKILYLNEAYTRAIVTGPTYGYLWILTREPDISEDALDELVKRAEKFGFNPEKLIFVDHSLQES